MKDLHSSRLIWLKAWLFVFIGLASATLLLLANPTFRTALFLILTVWAFCRAYYFAFYVIEHYIDPRFRYAGLWQFVREHIAKPQPRREEVSVRQELSPPAGKTIAQ